MLVNLLVGLGVVTQAQYTKPASLDPVKCGKCYFENVENGVLSVQPDGCRATCGKLDLRTRTISSIPEDMFQKADMKTRLRFLWLDTNRMYEYPAGIFDGLAALENLRIKENPTKGYPANLLSGRGLAALKIIQAGSNHLLEIPAGFLSGITTLESVDFHGAMLKALPADLLTGLVALEAFYANSNRLTSIPAGLFADTKAIQGISLQGNELTDLPDTLFDGLDGLQALRLHGNMLTALKASWFADLGALRELNLQDNMITSLDAGIFDACTKLREVTMQNNGLATIPEGVFEGISTLAMLDLSNNALRTLPGTMFSGDQSWAVVLLDNNPITCNIDMSKVGKYTETPANFGDVGKCGVACTMVNYGTLGTEVMEINGSRGTTTETAALCHELCKTNGAEVFTFKDKTKACKCKMMLDGFKFFSKQKLVSGYVVDTFVDTPCA